MRCSWRPCHTARTFCGDPSSAAWCWTSSRWRHRRSHCWRKDIHRYSVGDEIRWVETVGAGQRFVAINGEWGRTTPLKNSALEWDSRTMLATRPSRQRGKQDVRNEHSVFLLTDLLYKLPHKNFDLYTRRRREMFSSCSSCSRILPRVELWTRRCNGISSGSNLACKGPPMTVLMLSHLETRSLMETEDME